MSFAEVEKFRMLQRASEPLREIELERRRLVAEAGPWEPEEAPPVARRVSWRALLAGLLLRKPSTQTSSSAS